MRYAEHLNNIRSIHEREGHLTAGRVRRETINEFVQMIESVQGEKQTVRSENNQFSMWEAEGSEAKHLRIFYKSIGIELNDAQLQQKDRELDISVANAILRLEYQKSLPVTVMEMDN